MTRHFSPNTPLAIKRGNRRKRVAVPVTLLSQSGETQAKLCNVSRTGALAEASRPLTRGSSVIVQFGICMVPALVAWVAGPRFGLEFDRVLAEDELAGLGPSRRM